MQTFFAAATNHDIRAAGWLDQGTASDDESIAYRVQAFLVRFPGFTAIVDPCVGNGKTRSLPDWNGPNTDWLDRLSAAGRAPDDVDMVIHTHLHEDHIGWDTRLVEGEWAPTFSRARHIYVDDELDFRRTTAVSARPGRPSCDVYADSIEPVFTA